LLALGFRLFDRCLLVSLSLADTSISFDFGRTLLAERVQVALLILEKRNNSIP